MGSLQADSLSVWVALIPDSRLYLEAAQAIATSFDWNTDGVVMFGPGYPAFLALWDALGMHHPVWLLSIQNLVAGAGAVLLAMLAFRLTRDRAVATVAGLIHAASLASISLACAILSDAVFLAVLLGGLVLFESAASRNSLARAALAGLLLAAAVLVRTSGLVAVLLLPFLVLHHAEAKTRTMWAALWDAQRVLAVTTVLLLAGPLCWAWRNHAEYGVAFVSKSGAVAQVRMAAAIQSETDGSDLQTTLVAIGDSVVAEASGSTGAERTFSEAASEHFWKRVRSHPGAALRSYRKTVGEASHTDWGTFVVQLPAWDAPIRSAIHWSDRYGLRYRTLVLSCLGIVVLVATRRYRVAATLGFAYLLFALTAGLSLWQGNRIFYPGQIAWTVLVAVVLVRIGVRIRVRLQFP